MRRAYYRESVDLDLVFLGTSASMPTALRAPAAILVRRGGERLLFDCAVAASDALGGPPGRGRGLLQDGEAVTLADGRVVAPEAVLGAPRPGRTVVITGDTAPAPSVVQAAHHADLLVHEATFAADEAERARETLHATAAEAAEVARLADVRLLALTHVSTRYFGPELAREAREIFADTVVPRDFDSVEGPYPERGAPQLVKAGARP